MPQKIIVWNYPHFGTPQGATPSPDISVKIHVPIVWLSCVHIQETSDSLLFKKFTYEMSVLHF